MTRHEAYEYWLMRYNKAKDYDDPHWEAEERAEHHRWLEAMKQAMEALKDTSVSVDGDTVKLRKGVKKFRAENYVIYDVNYLLENLAREIFMLYQAKGDFDKPLFDFDNIRRMFVDYNSMTDEQKRTLQVEYSGTDDVILRGDDDDQP